MKKLAFIVVIGTAAMIAACNSSNQDQVNNAELNQPSPELNSLANNAANDAAVDNALGNQAAENTANATEDNTVNPQDADEQNVSGM